MPDLTGALPNNANTASPMVTLPVSNVVPPMENTPSFQAFMSHAIPQEPQTHSDPPAAKTTLPDFLNTLNTTTTPPMVNLPISNVVPPIGATPFKPATGPIVPKMANVPPMKGTGAGVVAHTGLTEIAEEIGKAMASGDTKKLHELQTEYDSTVAQERQSALAAYQKATESADTQQSPFAQFLPKPGVAKQAAATTVKPAEAKQASLAVEGAQAGAFAADPAETKQAAAATTAKPAEAKQAAAATTVKPAEAKQAAAATTAKPAEAKQAEVRAIVPPMQAQPTLHAEKPNLTGEKNMPNAFGVSDACWEKVCQNDEIKSALLSLPQNVVEMYKGIPEKDKMELARKAEGKTNVFLFTIDNRDAFISGKVMGRDTFQFMKENLDKQVDDGKIPLEAALRQENALEILRTLTPEQRAGILTLVEAETGMASKSSGAQDT